MRQIGKKEDDDNDDEVKWTTRNGAPIYKEKIQHSGSYNLRGYPLLPLEGSKWPRLRGPFSGAGQGKSGISWTLG